MSERQEVENEAARWLVRRGEPSWNAAEQDELEAWLDTSFAHKAAFWRLEHGWNLADRVVAVAPPSRHGGWRLVLRIPTIRQVMPTALAASIAAAVAMPVWLSREAEVKPQAYLTNVGQTRTIMTEDGSRIQLNTGTAVRTKVVADGRDAWLDRGEAFFDIHHEDGRPFRVHAGPKTITVLGTRFSVRRDGDRVTVAVVSGRVRIDDAGPATAPEVPAQRSATVTAGDVAVSGGTSMLVAADAPERIEQLTAWRDGMAIFDQTPLSDAVAELNRYTAKPIVIDDPQVARFRIGGSFKVENSEGFLRLLQSAYGLDVERRANAIHVRR